MAWADLVGRVVARAFATFNETISYTPPGGGVAIEIQGIYRQEPIEVALGDGSILSSTRHVLDLRRDDVSGGPKQNAAVTVRSVSYTVASVDGPDDAGVCKLLLERVS